MKILVGIPTYNNSRSNYSIRQTLEALSNQTIKDSHVLIVYKPSPGDRTLDVVSEFKDGLDIEVKIQSYGFFEEAMNIIFEASKDYDITLTTDDDAIPSETWINEHVIFHKNHDRIAIVHGITIPTTHYCYEHLRTVKLLINYYKPLIKLMVNYSNFIINDIGLLVCKGKEPFNGNANTHDYELDIGIRGVNMSFKSGPYIDGFSLPGYTIRGIRNEQLLALHYLKQGFNAASFNGGAVRHLERESLSRPKDPRTAGIEEYLFPYGVHYYGFKINMRKLKLYYNLVRLYSKIRKTPLSKAYRAGLELAIEAIENNYEPKEIRSRFIEFLSERQ